MLEVIDHGDVVRLSFSSPASRVIRYAASAYLVRGVLVDTGIPHARRELLRFIETRRPRGAMVTHHHEDHAGNVRALAERGVPLAMSDATLALVRAPEPLRPYRRISWGTMPPLDVPHESFDAGALQLMATPGHSADHHAVWDAETATLFGGDLFLGTRVRVAHDEEDPRALAASLRAAAALRPARLFDGHRGLVASPANALLAKAAWLDETVGRIVERASAGWSVRAIARDVLGRETATGIISLGHYSHAAFVRTVLRPVTPANAPSSSAPRTPPPPRPPPRAGRR